MLPAVAVYIGWSWLYESNFGLFNYVLNELGIHKVNFIADPQLVVPSLAVIAVWLSGNLIVIFLAGLQNVPRIYHEAAEIDGANAWQRFRHVTIPSMTPILFYNLLMALVTNLQVVTPALALTSGGPGNSSMFITYLMYRYAFKSSQLGYASAISFIFFIIVAAFTGILFATSKDWVFYEGGNE
jgi:multiple sugar transport system permease protein